MGVKVLNFVSWSLLPRLELRASGEGSREMLDQDLTTRSNLLVLVLAEIDAYLEEFKHGEYYFEPRYMKLKSGAAHANEGWLRSS